MKRVVILDDYQRVARDMADWSALDGAVEIVQLDRHIGDRDALVDALAGAPIVVAMRERTPFDSDLFERLGDLRLLVTTGMVNRSIDLDAAKTNGIVVSGTPGSRGSAAELAWALMLALSRRIPSEVEGFRSADPRWQRDLGLDLRGRTLGLAGFGNLGQRMARIGNAFDMEVCAWSRSLTDETAAEHGVSRMATLDDLLAASDVVSIHLTQTSETIGLIGARELGLMKPSAYLINTARGPIVDETALVAALSDGRIAGAGLDVFDIEPLPVDHPFRTMEQVVATPHLGYVTEETYRVYFAGAVEAIGGFLAGTPVNVLNP